MRHTDNEKAGKRNNGRNRTANKGKLQKAWWEGK